MVCPFAHQEALHIAYDNDAYYIIPQPGRLLMKMPIMKNIMLVIHVIVFTMFTINDLMSS